MTKRFLIENTLNGTTLGAYEGETERDALDAMARDAGYVDHRAACAVAPVQPGELLVRPLGTAILSAIDFAIDRGADAEQPGDDWQPGDPDGCWEHPAAREARELTETAGLSWDFTTWAAAREMVAVEIDNGSL